MPDITVGMADLRVTANAAERLVTYALGSCLGITVHDPVAGVGGMVHVMLPLSTIDPAKAQANPAMFVDTGVPALFKACYRLGAEKPRMIVKVAGGASSAAPGEPDQFQIGKRNVLTLRKLLWKNGVLLHGEEVGGHQLSRTMALDVATGAVSLKIGGALSTL